eukprot:6518675-Karenia_brevis.AAC.1
MLTYSWALADHICAVPCRPCSALSYPPRCIDTYAGIGAWAKAMQICNWKVVAGVDLASNLKECFE